MAVLHAQLALAWLAVAAAGCGRLGFDPAAGSADGADGVPVDGALPVDARSDAQLVMKTAGKTQVGSIKTGVGTTEVDRIRASPIEMTEAGLVVALLIHLDSSPAGEDAVARLMLFDSAGELPHGLRAWGEEPCPAQPERWYRATLAEPVLVEAGTYWLGLAPSDPNVRYTYDVVEMAMQYGDTPFADGPPAEFPTRDPPSIDDRLLDAYVEYLAE